MADTLKKSPSIVCLGGGIGTVNLIKGLKKYTPNITVIVSAADDGGSAGRLRRLYNIFPPGDAVSCLAALLPEEKEDLAKLLTYRFPGNRYAKDEQLAGHKMGNLLFVAAKEVTGDVDSGLSLLERLFKTSGKVLPATKEALSLSAQTIENTHVEGEQKIDLGKYKGKRILSTVAIHPANPTVPEEVLAAIRNADVIIAGPGDLYTTILPVLMIPAIANELKSSTAKKLYIVNVANKPFETEGYSIDAYIEAIKKHMDFFPFDTIIANNNTSFVIPSKYKYSYVSPKKPEDNTLVYIFEDLADSTFPLYHDPQKLARTVVNHI